MDNTVNRRKGILTVCLSVLLVSLLCLGLCRVDNKYTKDGIQPVSGVLFFEEGAEKTWLVRQWVMWPDVLLTPQTAEDYSGYRVYADMGGQNPDFANHVTYGLTLLLPEEPGEYALEVPEIFSSSKIYIDGRLVLQLGEPSAEGYREGISSSVVTFTASGETKLLIAASDFSGVQKGMQYPPAFGEAHAVQAMREVRLLLHGAMVFLAVVGALLVLGFGAGFRLLGLCLCICLAVVSGYPLYHGFFITGVQPWYTLEPLCYYGMLLVSLLLMMGVYGLPLRQKVLLALPCGAGLLLTLLRFGGSAWMGEEAAAAFSWLSAGLKYYTAVCLIGLSAWALSQRKAYSALLLTGSWGLAVCLLWDRAVPLFEPIYGGWLGEIGIVILVASLAAALWMDAADAYRFRLSHETSLQQMEQRLAMQKEHYAQLAEQVKLARQAGHDLRHHVRTMRTMADREQWEKLYAYLQEYEAHVAERSLTIWSDHPAADAVLRHYAAAASRLQAVYDVRLAIPPDLGLPDAELCILLGNLLENAMEAMERQPEGLRKIYLRGSVSEGHLGLVSDNTFDGQLQEKDGMFLSRKHAGYGLGLSSIATIAEKYGGMADFSAADGIFHVSVMIPLQTAAGKGSAQKSDRL